MFEKMNTMDWLARYSEYLTPDSITNTVLAFKELYTTDNTVTRNSFINSKHSSEAINTVIFMIHAAKNQRVTDTSTNNSALSVENQHESKLAILLSIMEPLLINDQNLEKAI